jgi:glycerate-2-kinase
MNPPADPSADPPANPPARDLLHALLAHERQAPVAERLLRAADHARARGLVVLPLGLQAADEARELAQVHAAIALQGVRHGRPAAPTVILSAGPVLRAGAPAQAPDLLIALLLALDEHPAIHAAAGDCSARAWTGCLGPDTMRRARDRGLFAADAVRGGKPARFFEQLGDAEGAAAAAPQGPDATAASMVLRAILLTAY